MTDLARHAARLVTAAREASRDAQATAMDPDRAAAAAVLRELAEHYTIRPIVPELGRSLRLTALADLVEGGREMREVRRG